MIVPAQTRAARGLLGWSQTQLGDAAKLSLATVRRFETGNGHNVSYVSVRLMRAALEAAGVIFIAENSEGVGVRLRNASSRPIAP